MPLWLPITIVVLTLVVQGPLTLRTTLLDRDDAWLTAPLESVHTVGDWWALVHSGKLPDFQPLRDFSYWLDWRIAEALGTAPHFHVTSMLIWWVCLALFFDLATRVEEAVVTSAPQTLRSGPRLAPAATILMAIHPVAVEPLVWISGRKHLLSLAFILIATREVLRLGRTRSNWKRLAVVAACYGAAILSQPINILWPAWAVFFLWYMAINRRIAFKLAVALVPLVLVALALNLSVYQGIKWFGFELTPHAALYGKKLGTLRGDEIDLSLLAIGRYAFNLAVPFKIVHRYDPGALANLVGLFMIPLVAWTGWRQRTSRRFFFLWFLYATLPILVVTLQLSDIFVSDSYGLAALPGFILMVLIAGHSATVTTFREKNRLLSGAMVAAIAGMMFSQSIRLGRAWLSSRHLWNRTHAIEATPDSLYFVSAYLFEDGKFDDAMTGAQELIARAYINEKTVALYVATVCNNPRLSVSEMAARFTDFELIHLPPVQDCLSRQQKIQNGNGSQPE